MSKSKEIVIHLGKGDHLNAKQISAVSRVVCIVSKKMTETKDFTAMNELLDECRKAGCRATRKLKLVFEGFNPWEKDLTLVPEIREYVQMLFAKFPGFPVFLTERSMTFSCECMLDFEESDWVVPLTKENDLKISFFAMAVKSYAHKMCDYCSLGSSYNKAGNNKSICNLLH